MYRLRPSPEPAAVDFYRTIVGAERCAERPGRCDLSRGIVTDDEAGTVAFHLSAPDPEFPFKLAMPFAYVVPTGTSVHKFVRRPLPATGPYRLASVSRHRSRYVRNERFREWSSAAQPAGFPDEIVVSSIPSAARRTRQVAAGRGDWTGTFAGQALPVPFASRPQLHVEPAPGILYLVLDSTRPPFDDVRARRAVNFALDRNKVARLAGEGETVRPTCQVLPPNFPGYRGYCPYTLDPNAGEGWTAPDLAKARRLVSASGTSGMSVSLWWPKPLGARHGEYFAALLESLGYRTSLRLFQDVGAYFTAVGKSRRGWQVAGSGWGADYPAASTFIGLLSCAHQFNLGHFCDRKIDAEIRRALRLQERDPARANESWAALDRELTDQAPWVFLYSQNSVTFVSKRVGNYQHHPLFGTLYAQLWVR